MISQREKDFISYWERNRDRRKKVMRQFLIGIPMGLLFAVPIIINFTSGWDWRADMEANAAQFNPMVLLVALLLIVGFTSIFYQRHKWDQYEQRYRELLAKQEREAVAANTGMGDGAFAGGGEGGDGEQAGAPGNRTRGESGKAEKSDDRAD